MTRRAVVVGAVAAVLVVLIWWFLLWRPQQKKVSDARDRREVAEQQVSQLRVTLGRLQELKRTEALKRSQIEPLRVAVPEQPNLALFILDANEAANRAGIDFLSISPGQPVAGAGTAPATISLSMTITGGYFQVLDFMNRLTDLPRIVVIDTVSMGAGGGAAGAPSDLNVSLTARMFTTSQTAGGATTTTVAPGTTPTTTVPGTGAPTTTTGAP